MRKQVESMAELRTKPTFYLPLPGGFDKNKPLMRKLGKYKTRKARRRVNLPRGKAVLLPESG